jgi:hypothetical protein
MLIVHFRSFRLFQRPLTAGEIKPRGEQNELLRNRQGMFLGLRGHSLVATIVDIIQRWRSDDWGA